jgi:hypothetical protein
MAARGPRARPTPLTVAPGAGSPWHLPKRHLPKRGALLLQTCYERLTKDSDVLETGEIDEAVRRQFEEPAGKR